MLKLVLLNFLFDKQQPYNFHTYSAFHLYVLVCKFLMHLFNAILLHKK